MDNALQAINIAMALITRGVEAYERAQAALAKARAEGRDVSDAELDALRKQSEDALADFRSQVG